MTIKAAIFFLLFLAEGAMELTFTGAGLVGVTGSGFETSVTTGGTKLALGGSCFFLSLRSS